MTDFICAECASWATPSAPGKTVHIVRCMEEPIHFINSHVHITNQQNEDIPFRLWVWQEDVLGDLIAQKRCVYLKTRGIGLTWLIAAYALWASLLRGWSVVIGSRTEDLAKDMMRRVQYIRKSVEGVFPSPTKQDGMTLTIFRNKGVVISETAGENMGSGYHPTIFILDEWAKIQQDALVTTSVMGAVGAKGQFVGFSTPLGYGNQFEKYYHSAEAGKNKFHWRRLHWKSLGERDKRWAEIYNDAWYKSQCELLDHDRSRIAQELDCDFVQSGSPAFLAHDLDIVWGWEAGESINGPRKASEDERVIIAIDPASGESGGSLDNTSVHVVDGAGNEIHHEAWQKTAPDARERLIVLFAQYTKPIVVIERNALGLTYVDWFRRSNNVVEVQTTAGIKEVTPQLGHLGRPGMEMVNQWWWSVGKATLIRYLQLDIENHAFKGYSPETRGELLSFQVQGPDRFGAPSGQLDDRVMSLALARWAFRKGWAMSVEEKKMHRQVLEKDYRIFKLDEGD